MPTLTPNRITPLTQLEYDQTYGGALVLMMIMLVLYGMSVLQTWLYYLRFEHDTLRLKSMVFLVWVLSTVHAALIGHAIYYYLIFSYSQPLILADGVWSLFTAVPLGYGVNFCVQGFFAHTIFNMTKRWWRWTLSVFFSGMIIAQLIMGIVETTEWFHLWVLSKLSVTTMVLTAPRSVLQVVLDLIMSIALCLLLTSARTKTSGKSVQLLNSLIIYVLVRFVVTTIGVLVQAVILFAKPHTLWAVAMEFPLVHLYVNSLLAFLNARTHLRAMDGGNTSAIVEPKSMEFNANRGYDNSEIGEHSDSQRPSTFVDSAASKGQSGSGTSNRVDIELRRGLESTDTVAKGAELASSREEKRTAASSDSESGTSFKPMTFKPHIA